MLARIGAVLSLLAALVFTSGAALADSRGPVVVELFTSQGCSSCPPADDFLRLLAPREDVIALGFHVDYWDYLGWRDKFAQPDYTARQKSYAKFAGRRSVYTPQMVIGGAEDVVGNHPMDVTDLIAVHRDRPQRVSLSLSRSAGGVQIEAQLIKPVDGPLMIQLIRYVPEAQVNILRGENAGQRMSYANIVTEWRVLTKWSGREPIKLRAKVKGDAPIVVLVQHAGLGPIEAAARLR